MVFKKIDPAPEGFWNHLLYNLRNRNRLELYCTNSLGEMCAYFAEHPPSTKERRFFNGLSAYITVLGASVRRNPGVPEEAVDYKLDFTFPSVTLTIPSKVFPNSCTCPSKRLTLPKPVKFEIKSGAAVMEAEWIAGRNEIYEQCQKRYNFNDRDFVPVGMLYVQYIHDNHRETLVLRHFDLDLMKQAQAAEKSKPASLEKILAPAYKV